MTLVWGRARARPLHRVGGGGAPYKRGRVLGISFSSSFFCPILRNMQIYFREYSSVGYVKELCLISFTFSARLWFGGCAKRLFLWNILVFFLGQFHY